MFVPIYQYLAAAAPVVAIAGDRLYRGIAPQRLASASQAPMVVWDMAGGLPQNYLGDTPGIDQQSIDLRCYAVDEAVAESLAEAVRDALQPWGQSNSAPISEWEFETKLHVVMLSFSFWTNRP